jgi:Tfp pilus assembly protein PilV
MTRNNTIHAGAKRQGATIIELAACIMILAVALPTLLKTFAEASMKSMHPANEAMASFLAIDRMEEIVARRYRGTDGYSAVTTANFPNESPVSGFTGFTRSVTVTTVDSSLATVGSDVGYKKVRVTVTWNSGANSLVIERIFADFGTS